LNQSILQFAFQVCRRATPPSPSLHAYPRFSSAHHLYFRRSSLVSFRTYLFLPQQMSGLFGAIRYYTGKLLLASKYSAVITTGPSLPGNPTSKFQCSSCVKAYSNSLSHARRTRDIAAIQLMWVRCMSTRSDGQQYTTRLLRTPYGNPPF